MLYLYEIKKLYEDIDNFEVSPFETIEILHVRSEMNEVQHLLTEKEKKELEKCDCKMLANAEALLHHLQVVYDFANTKRPVEEWWWHLGKVSPGELTVTMEIKSI
jgi:transcriptional/translational regulatory protein YebC/TACO1